MLSTEQGRTKEHETPEIKSVPTSMISEQEEVAPTTATQKKLRKIRWADSAGDNLVITQEKTETKDEVPAPAKKSESRVKRWAKKKDASNEKDMLLQARKNSQMQDDKEDLLNAMAMMAGPWKTPPLLPEDLQNPPVQVQSKELSLQAIRMNSVPAVLYASETLVPIDPALISDAEKALDILNIQPPKEIPFFAPPPAAPIPTVAPPAFPPPPSVAHPGATLEQLIAMGLPLFLVGSDMQALQTLVAAPSLLTTFRDGSGNYDQNGLMNLVNTLTQQLKPSQQPQAFSQNIQQLYQPPPVAQPGLFSTPALVAQAQPTQTNVSRGYRGDQNLGEANLHLSGYGPTTTTEEIIQLFAPYVHVTEVVPKSNFSFVNTRDPEGAKRAREALNGSLLGGMPCRINMATRKIRPADELAMTPAMNPAPPGDLSSLPRNSLGQVDYSAVTDDRGNPATKNLFMAGYGPGTTDQELRDLVGQYATVVSVVLKATFAFVNTTDRDAAVIARQTLNGTMLNGGPLRINFAKESGRLGTSFGDSSTYGPAATAGIASGVTAYGYR